MGSVIRGEQEEEGEVVCVCVCACSQGGEVCGFLTPPGDIKDLSTSMVDVLAWRARFPQVDHFHLVTLMESDVTPGGLRCKGEGCRCQCGGACLVQKWMWNRAHDR